MPVADAKTSDNAAQLNMALPYLVMARYDEPVQLYARALKINMGARGPDHPKTAERTEALVNPSDVRAVEYARPGIRVETIEHHVRAVLAGLEENSHEVVEEGGQPLSESARNFVADATSEIVVRALLSPTYSIEDLTITPFARTDGGAHLLVDFDPTEKRLSVHIGPEGIESWATLTGAEGSHGEAVGEPGQLTRYLGWLTKKDR